MTDTIVFDTILKLVGPLSGKGRVRKLEFVALSTKTRVIWVPRCKLREFSQLFVIDVVENEADFVIGFEEAADHSGIVEDLSSPFN